MQMKVIKEIGVYLLLVILAVSGVVFLFLLPSEISSTIVASIIGFGVFVGFCFVLYFINKFPTKYEHSDNVKRWLGY